MLTPRHVVRLLARGRRFLLPRLETLEDRNAPNSFLNPLAPMTLTVGQSEVMAPQPGPTVGMPISPTDSTLSKPEGSKPTTSVPVSMQPVRPRTTENPTQQPIAQPLPMPVAPPGQPGALFGDPLAPLQLFPDGGNRPAVPPPLAPNQPGVPGLPQGPLAPAGPGAPGTPGLPGGPGVGGGGLGGGLFLPSLPPTLPPIGIGGNGTVRFSLSADRGLSGTDNISNDATPTLSGTARPRSTHTVFINGVARGTVTANASGSFSRVLPRLPDGTHVISVGRGGQPLTWTVDTVAPKVRLQAPEFVTTATPQVTVHIDHGNSPFMQSRVLIDVDLNRDGVFQANERGYATQMVFGSTATLTLPELQQGSYRLRAQVINLAGNLGTSSVTTMEVDPHAGRIGQTQLSRLIRAYERFGDQTIELFRDTAFYTTAGQGLPIEVGPMGGPEAVLVNPLRVYRMDKQDRFLVSVRATQAKHLEALETSLKNDLGMEVVNKTNRLGQYMVTGWLALDQLGQLETLEHFNTATLVIKPISRVGAVTSQGDQAMRAAPFRNETGFDGAGVTVGVLSDSVNQFAGGLADSVATGDLPANVVVLQDDTSGSDEGRAMLEIVHDLAPGANLMFRTAFLGATDFAQGIRDLFNAGATVITDDIGYANSPFFNDGVIALAATEVFDKGAVYTSAAGNAGDEGFRTAWSGANTTIDSITGTFFTFGGGDFLQNVTIANGETLQINVQWDNAFLEGGSALANFQVGTNIDVHLLNNAGTIVQSWTDVNSTTDEALEFVSYTNTGTNTSFALAFQLVSGPAPTRLAWTNFGGDNPQAQGQGATTIFGQVAARGAMATGAVNALDGTIQPYSSLGGNLEILFSANGTRLSTPEIRRKPDVAGSDNTNTTFFGSDDPNDADTFPNFSGTSAAAPHVAAAAALILSQEPRATNEDVFLHLQLTALDLGEPGFDFLTGAGLVQLTPIRLGPQPVINDNNETSDQASDLGLISMSQTITGSITVNSIGLPEYDWFKFTTPGGPMVARSRLLSGQTLEMNVYQEVRPGQIQLIGRSDVTSSSGGVSFNTTAGVTYYVEMKGKNIAPGVITQGGYRLSIRRSV